MKIYLHFFFIIIIIIIIWKIFILFFMFSQFPFQYSFHYHLVPFHFQWTLYIYFDCAPFATRKLQESYIKWRKKCKNIIYFAKIMCLISSYLNYAMKIKSNNLQTFTIMKKLLTFLPSFHHPKRCKMQKNMN